MSHRKTAFTLVELLVVIGIIAVLISILLPSLNKARMAAQSAQCLSNLRQCALGFQLYANDNRNVIAVNRTRLGNIRMWMAFLSHGYTSIDEPGAFIYAPRKANLCPTNRYAASDYNSTSLNNEAMRVGYAQFTVKGSSQAIYQNGFQQTKYLDGGTSIYTSSWWFVSQRLSKLPRPAVEQVLLADSVSTHPSSLDGGGHMIGTFSDVDTSDYAGRIHVVHGKYANIAFYDGHAAAMTSTQLRNETKTKPRHFVDERGGVFIAP